MQPPPAAFPPRPFLHAAAGPPAPLAASPRAFPPSQPPARAARPRKKLDVVTTAYYYLSHAYHLCGRFLNGYRRAGRFHHPDCAGAGLFVDQVKQGDLSRELARKHRFTLYPDVARALTLGGD